MHFEVVCLNVAGLEIWLDASKTGLKLVPPLCHDKFIQSDLHPKSQKAHNRKNPQLILNIVNKAAPIHGMGVGAPVFSSEIWDLKLNKSGDYIFSAPREVPPISIVIDAGFSRGKVYGDYSSSGYTGIYPPQNLEIIIYGNWLASMGDVILHASGMAIDGKGYCFIGESGAGKSTLIRSLMSNLPITVLGEDQIILRYIENRFWIFGTPWHQDPEICSPIGVPLEKLFFLERADGQKVKPISPADGVTRILQTAFVPFYQTKMLQDILNRLALLSEEIPFYSLSYQLGTDTWPIIQSPE